MIIILFSIDKIVLIKELIKRRKGHASFRNNTSKDKY